MHLRTGRKACEERQNGDSLGSDVYQSLYGTRARQIAPCLRRLQPREVQSEGCTETDKNLHSTAHRTKKSQSISL